MLEAAISSSGRTSPYQAICHARKPGQHQGRLRGHLYPARPAGPARVVAKQACESAGRHRAGVGGSGRAGGQAGSITPGPQGGGPPHGSSLSGAGLQGRHPGTKRGPGRDTGRSPSYPDVLLPTQEPPRAQARGRESGQVQRRVGARWDGDGVTWGGTGPPGSSRVDGCGLQAGPTVAASPFPTNDQG